MAISIISWSSLAHYFFFFFFNDTATTEIYTLSLHDALPISKDEFYQLATSYVENLVEFDDKIIEPDYNFIIKLY